MFVEEQWLDILRGSIQYRTPRVTVARPGELIGAGCETRCGTSPAVRSCRPNPPPLIRTHCSIPQSMRNNLATFIARSQGRLTGKLLRQDTGRHQPFVSKQDALFLQVRRSLSPERNGRRSSTLCAARPRLERPRSVSPGHRSWSGLWVPAVPWLQSPFLQSQGTEGWVACWPPNLSQIQQQAPRDSVP
jgi:hypothetical protein